VAKYTVIGTDLKHKKVTYPEGSTIELTAAEAAAVSAWVEPVKGSQQEGDTNTGGTGETETTTDSTGSDTTAGESDEASGGESTEEPAGEVPAGAPTKNKKEK
jgi:hypothetical protein